MFLEADSDVKIFGAQDDGKSPEKEKNIIEQLEKHQKNGNIERAKNLGKMLADELLPENSISQFGFANGVGYPNENIEISFQRRILLAFCVEVGLEIYIDNNIVSSAAVSEFHNRIENEYPDFYKSIMDLGAFSLYYLGLRTESKVEKAMGAIFARLCHESRGGLYAEFGEALFIYFMDTISKMVSEQGFVDLNEKSVNDNTLPEMKSIDK